MNHAGHLRFSFIHIHKRTVHFVYMNKIVGNQKPVLVILIRTTLAISARFWMPAAR